MQAFGTFLSWWPLWFDARHAAASSVLLTGSLYTRAHTHTQLLTHNYSYMWLDARHAAAFFFASFFLTFPLPFSLPFFPPCIIYTTGWLVGGSKVVDVDPQLLDPDTRPGLCALKLLAHEALSY